MAAAAAHTPWHRLVVCRAPTPGHPEKCCCYRLCLSILHRCLLGDFVSGEGGSSRDACVCVWGVGKGRQQTTGLKVPESDSETNPPLPTASSLGAMALTIDGDDPRLSRHGTSRARQ